MAATSSAQNGSRAAHGKAQANDKRQGLWSSMLDNAASGKRLAEKQLLVLGGSLDSQKAFLDALAQEPSQARRSRDRTQNKRPLVANRFALGYTYQDVLDTDHDDILARLSIYLLSDPHPSFSHLLDPLFTAEKIPETLAVILLDWASPWTWLRQLCTWIQLLRRVIERIDPDAQGVMDENVRQWTERRVGVTQSATTPGSPEQGVGITLGPGEWDEPIGIPLCVVCQDAEKIEIFEREHGWKDDEFDFVLQHLRTVLLKHGGALIYTASAAPGQLRPLIRSCLGIKSLLEKTPVKHNIVDRDKVCVPPNWDSWGKIRVLKEGFDAEAISKAWSIDLEQPMQIDLQPPSSTATTSTDATGNKITSAIKIFEEVLHDPHVYDDAALTFGAKDSLGVDVECPDNQEFFTAQLQTLDRLRAQDESDQKAKDAKRPNQAVGPATPRREAELSSVSEHLGPVQMNVGGIQVDADDVLQTSKDPKGENEGGKGANTPGGTSIETERLASFFAELMHRGTPTNSPKPSNSPKHS